jgi:hypothetical protein
MNPHASGTFLEATLSTGHIMSAKLNPIFNSYLGIRGLPPRKLWRFAAAGLGFDE